jgi:hypothetical protein
MTFRQINLTGFKLSINPCMIVNKQICTILVFCILISTSLIAQVQSEWRGIGRTGVYPETGLLKQWPAGGPELLWISKNLPKGYSSVAVGNNSLYLSGLEKHLWHIQLLLYKKSLFSVYLTSLNS